MRWILVALLLIGCAKEGVKFSNVVNYKSNVKIISVKKRVVNDLLEVDIKVKNYLNIPQKLQYKISWYDKDGFFINSQPFTSLYLKPYQEKDIMAVATDKEAVDFKIELRSIK